MAVRARLKRLRPRRLNMLPDVAPAEENLLPPSEIRRGMRISITEGIFAQTWFLVTVGSLFTGLMLRLGADNFALGLIAALPVASQLFQLIAAWWVERRGNRRFIVVSSSFGRLLWIIPPALLWVPMDGSLRLGLAILAMAIGYGLLAVTSNAWFNWMSDLIPANLRGRFFGTRATVTAVVSMLTIWLGGAWLDFMRSSDSLDLGYLLLYGFACACGLVSTIMVARQPEPAMREGPRMRIGSLLGAPLRDKRFRTFMITLLCWGVFVNIAGPFYSPHALKNLHMSFQQLALTDAVTAAVSILTQPFWGRFSDRVGHARTLQISMLGASPLALTWLFVTPDIYWVLYLNSVVSGIFWPGLNLALNNRLMELAPAQGRGGYLAAYSAVTGVAAFLASIIGGSLIDAATGVQLDLGPLVLNNYQIIFLTAGVGRILSVVVGSRNL